MELLLPSLGLIFWTLLAFIIVFLILKKFAWKPILNSLDEREKGIADSLSTAERVRAEMTHLQNENEILLAQAREERGAMLKEAREIKEIDGPLKPCGTFAELVSETPVCVKGAPAAIRLQAEQDCRDHSQNR